MAKLAIGIPCYNEEQHIEGTLLSAIQQLDGFSDLEIFISDNQSIDNSVLKIEGTLDAIKSAKNHVTLTNQEKHIAANENFWHVFDNTDSEFFMWLGGHDQISAGYVYRGVTHMTQCLKTGLFCGAHRAIGEGSAFDNVAKYDFSHDNPVERYLQAIAQLDNCYIFHSIFRRKDLIDFERFNVPGGDHILISHLLWAGTLYQSGECSYVRRYFAEEERTTKIGQGIYPHTKNNVAFYEGYLQDLRKLTQPLPDLVSEAILAEASSLLIKRFGLPFLTQ